MRPRFPDPVSPRFSETNDCETPSLSATWSWVNPSSSSRRSSAIRPLSASWRSAGSSGICPPHKNSSVVSRVKHVAAVIDLARELIAAHNIDLAGREPRNGTSSVSAIAGNRPQGAPECHRSQFVADSPLEGDGFELPVPGRETVKPSSWKTGRAQAAWANVEPLCLKFTAALTFSDLELEIHRETIRRTASGATDNTNRCDA